MTDDELAWETLDSRVVYRCPGFDIYNEDVRFPNGNESEFDYLSEKEAVVVLPFTTGGDVVVIDEWRQAVKRVNRSLPAGSIEADDPDRETAARRELAEESGYEAGALAHLTTVEPANGFADSVFHYFVAEGCVPTAESRIWTTTSRSASRRQILRICLRPFARTNSVTVGVRWRCCTTSCSSGRARPGATLL